MTTPHALIVGVGDGLSASLARLFAKEGYDLTLAARDPDKLDALAARTGARAVACDASKEADVDKLFSVPGRPLRIVVYNPSYRLKGPIAELEPREVRKAMEVTAFGAFLVGRLAAGIMLDQDPEDGVRGTILLTGASAGVKGFPQSAAFAMGKFAQRGLAQAMARELHPKGVHVAWVNIDGAIGNPGREARPDEPDAMLDPDEVARTYLMLVRQHRSAWSDEIVVRPWVETF